MTPLFATPQWIVVLLIPAANGKTDKLPVDYRTGLVTEKGSDGAHDPAIWMPYDRARTYAAAMGPSYTIGFVITANDPFFCLDIDGAAQPDGTWSPLAQHLVAALPGCSVEVSLSGKGLHIWGRGAVPPHRKKNIPLHIELYTERRFIAIGTNAVGEMAPECPQIAAIAAQYFPPAETAGEIPDEGPRADWRGPTDDDELLRRAMQSKSAASVFGGGKASFADLWHADAAVLARAYPADQNSNEAFDRSSADMALAQHLAFWTGCDVARIERLMQRSALKRDKWEREDYLVDRTIRGACAQQRDVLQYKHVSAAPAEAAAVRYGIVPDDPLNAARALVQRRYTHADGPCLKAWQGSIFRWGGACWHELSNEDARAMVYDFLDAHGESHYRPNQSKVSNLLDALKAAIHLDSRVQAPQWIDGPGAAPAGEIVACANGLLHLGSGQLLPPTPSFFNRNAVPFDYAPSGPEPAQWLRFLADVWPGDQEAIDTLQELFGYLLTPDTSQQKIFLIVGPKRSGKGTIARVLTELLGADNVAGPSLASLGGDFGLQPLIGKQAAIVSDARLGGHVDAARVAENLLRISGEDRLDVARKGTTSLSVRLATRFVLLTNELPRIADASGAMASRFIILTMSQSFLGREDHGLTARLLDELPGILRWAVAGWHRLRARGHFLEPVSSAGAVRELADLGSPIAAFVREECVCGPGADIECSALFDAWRTWCARQGMQHTGTAQTFGRDLHAAFPEITRWQPRVNGRQVRAYKGICLSPSG